MVAVTLLTACLACSSANAEAVGFRAKAKDFVSRLVWLTPTHWAIRSYVDRNAKTLPLSLNGPGQRIDTSRMPSFSFHSSARTGYINMVYAATDVKGRRVIIDWGYTSYDGRAVIPFSKLGWR